MRRKNGLGFRSRGPHRSPTRISDLDEDEIVAFWQAARRRGLDARGQDHPCPHLTTEPKCTVGFHDPERFQAVWLCHATAPQAPPFVQTFRGRAPQECWQPDVTDLILPPRAP